MALPARRIGILAGGGSLPREVAATASAHGHGVHIVAIEGEADEDLGPFAVTRVNWGQIGRMIRVLKAAGAQDLVIVGRVRRPDLMKLKPDLGFFQSLPAILKIIASGGDDSVLRRVVRFFEGHGLRVVGPADVAHELVIGEGAVGKTTPSAADAADIARGFDVIRAIGAYDIGQSVIVTGGWVEAIEAAEGTDAMLERVSRARRAREPGGILVKRSKPGQELRVDMPAIGPDTVARVVEAGLRGIAVEAGRVLVAQRSETVRRADAAGVFVAGCEDAGGAQVSPPSGRTPAILPLARLGRVAAHARDQPDIAKGIAVVGSLVPFRSGRASVVVRGHVLAVEAGEGVPVVVERASRLRQWDSVSVRRRRGVAVVGDAGDLNADLVAAAAQAGLSGLAVIGGALGGSGVKEAVSSADRAGLFIVARRGEGELA